MAEQPAWQPQCTAIYPEAPADDQRCVQPEGHQPVVELHYNRAGFGWSDKEVLTASVIDARERLARHLYVSGSALEHEAGQRWNAGEVPADRLADYRRAADRILAVIAGQEHSP